MRPYISVFNQLIDNLDVTILGGAGAVGRRHGASNAGITCHALTIKADSGIPAFGRNFLQVQDARIVHAPAHRIVFPIELAGGVYV